MASISANGSKGHHKFTLTVTESSTSISNNTSTVSFNFQLSPITKGYNWLYWTNPNKTVSYTVTIDGTTYTGTIPNYDGSSTVALKSGTQTVTHNADGTKTLSFSFSVTDTIPEDYSSGNASANGSLVLTAITRPVTGAAPIIHPYVEDINDKTIRLTGNSSKLIKYHSTAYATMDVSPQGGASIAEDYLIIRNGSATGYDYGVEFDNVESNVFTFSAEDDRGYVGTATVTANMVNYVPLTCTMANCNPDANGDMRLSCFGNYFNGNFGAQYNSLTVEYEYIGSYGSYGSGHMTVSTSGNAYSAYVDLSELSYQETYTFTITATDKLEEVETTNSGIKSKPIFHWGQNDFAFEVPVKFNSSLSVGNLSISSSTLTSGTWSPTLPYAFSYTVREGWYQRIGNCVVVGFNIKANCYSGKDNIGVMITDIPYPPAYDAFGGGVAYNLYVGDGIKFEGWGAVTSAKINGTTYYNIIVPRLQPVNNTSEGNLSISSTACYPSGDDTQVTLAGTICYYTTKTN